MSSLSLRPALHEGTATQKLVPWPSTGFVTLQQLLGRWGGPVPLSPSRWWRGVQDGEYPQPFVVGGRTVWAVAEVNALLEGFAAEGRALARRRQKNATR